LGELMETLIYNLADTHFFFTDFEVRDLDGRSIKVSGFNPCLFLFVVDCMLNYIGM